jgi:hypothetical protein
MLRRIVRQYKDFRSPISVGDPSFRVESLLAVNNNISAESISTQRLVPHKKTLFSKIAFPGYSSSKTP